MPLPRAGRAALALGSVAGLLVLAAPSVALFPDSMSYLGAGESIAAGRGISVPVADWNDGDSASVLTQFPPLYPLALAAPIALGSSPPGAAHWVAAMAAGVTIAAAAATAAVAGELAAPLAALLVAVSTPVFDAHLTALSEPLYIACTMLTLLALVRRAPPWVSGVTAAAAGLVRYAGASLSAGAALFFLVDRRGPRRWSAAAAALLPGMVAQLGWRWWAAAHGAEVPSAAARVYPGLGAAVGEGVRASTAWLAPGGGTPTLQAALACVVCLALCWLAWRLWSDGRGEADDGEFARLLAACAAIALSYVALFVYARLWVGGTIHFDQRTVAPLAAVGGVAIAAIVARAWAILEPGGRAVAATCLAAWLAGSLATDVRRLAWQREGIAFDHPRWIQSPAATWLNGDGRRYSIYTNHSPATYFLTHRPSRVLPSTLAPDTVAAFRRKFDADHGALYGLPTSLYPMAPADTLARLLGLRPVVQSELGTIWVR